MPQIVLSNRLQRLQQAAQGFGDTVLATEKARKDEEIRQLQLAEAQAQAVERDRLARERAATEGDIRQLRKVENTRLPDFAGAPGTQSPAPMQTGVDLGSFGGPAQPGAVPDIGIQSLQRDGQAARDQDLKDDLLARIRSVQTGNILTKEQVRKEREEKALAESRGTELFDLNVTGKKLDNQKTQKDLNATPKADYSHLDKVQLGDGSWGIVNKRNGSFTPVKDPAGKPVVGAVPAGGTKKNAPLPLAEAEEKANQTISVIDQMIGRKAKGRPGSPDYDPGAAPHPGFRKAVGARMNMDYAGGFKDKPFNGTEAAGFEALLNQVKGTAFLEAFQSLKGGGAITEVEGTKATQAITRMDQVQSEDEFMKAAEEFRDIVQRGIERRRQMERGGNPTEALDAVYGGPDIRPFLQNYKGKGGQ